ncbi:MAG: DNA helicase, partial [Acidobacteriota bacterium]|nr:DNA helicase [Acidobacteriota bacterium]
VRLATMHRVKGLEFDRVVMASVNADLVPLPAAVNARGDAVERESAETEERALVYVAATRAKRELLVLSFGTPSRLL